jgi:hypothetical protein
MMWDAFLAQARLFTNLQIYGEFLMMMVLGLQMPLLALVVFGTIYIVYNVSRRLIRAVWNWSKPTPMCRIAGALNQLACLRRSHGVESLSAS